MTTIRLLNRKTADTTERLRAIVLAEWSCLSRLHVMNSRCRIGPNVDTAAAGRELFREEVPDEADRAESLIGRRFRPDVMVIVMVKRHHEHDTVRRAGGVRLRRTGETDQALLLAAHGTDEFKTERQAAFMAQQLAGTRFKFPPKGKSCLKVLEAIQRSVTGNTTSEKTSLVEAPVSGKRSKINRRAAKSVRPHRIDRTVLPGLLIYCDGACEPNPGAGDWGFVVYQDGVEIHSNCGGADWTTNNIMEMTGALMALRWPDEHSKGATLLRPDTARLFCDSQYVVKGCNEWRHGWKRKGWRRGVEKELANADLWQALDEALTAVLITLEVVQGPCRHRRQRARRRAELDRSRYRARAEA